MIYQYSFSLGNLQYNTRSSTVHYECSGLITFLQSASALLQGIADVMPATFQLPHPTWNIPCCLKRKLNQWPQSSYISRPAGCPCVCFTPVCVSSVGIVSTTRAFCHRAAGLIRVLQSYVVLERSSTPQEAASTLQAPHSAVLLCLFDSSLASKDGVDPLSLFFLSFCVCVCVFTSEETRLRSEVDVTVSRLQWHFLFLISVPEQGAETESDQNRQRGRIAQNVLNFLIISLAAYALM